MFDLTGKTALITGASGGIGQAIAEKIHGQGAKIVISGTRRETLEELAAKLGDDVHILTASLEDPESIKTLAKEAESVLGQVDILVNNAGLTRDNLFLRMSDEEWQQVLDVNLMASFRLARALLRGMVKRRFGRIIGITSIVGVTGNAGQANYAASKAGMIGMSKALAQEVAARNVTVNCIAPGFIKTPMTDSLSEVQREKLLAAIPAGRLGTPEDVAGAVVYLASEESQYVTGQTLHVNGGMAMI